MKILILTPWYPDDVRKNHGIFVQEQALALATRHEVVVISSKINYKSFGLSSYDLAKFEGGNVTEYRLVIKASFPFYNQLNYFFISTKVAAKIAHEFKPGIIHGNIGYPGAFWAWLVSKKTGKKFIVTEHNSNFKNNFRSFFHRWLTVFPMKQARVVTSVSSHSADQINKYLEKEVRVVPNLIDVDRFSIAPFPIEIKVGFLGSLESPHHAKGLNILLQIISEVPSKFRLMIGGSGVMLEEYRLQAKSLGIEDRCCFKGYVNYEEVPMFMNQLSFFVNASKNESFGIAIVEALASGVPVVCFNNGGPIDFVNSFNGVLVENQNISELKESIEWMLKNYLNFDRQKIRDSVVIKYSRESFLKRIEEVYQSVVNSC